MALLSQAGNISVKAFQVKDPDLICEAYNLHPNDAAKREAQIAETMHRHIGLRGRLPKSQDIEIKQGRAADVIIRYLTKRLEGTTSEISASTGYNKRFVRDVLAKLLGAGIVSFTEFQRTNGGTPARLWTLTDDT